MKHEVLHRFIRLEARKRDLQAVFGPDLYRVELEAPPVVERADLERLLQAVLAGAVQKEQLLEWVNTVWFSGLFDLPDEDRETDCLVSVLEVLEAWDEPEVKLSEADLRRMIQCLRDGAEYVQQSW